MTEKRKSCKTRRRWPAGPLFAVFATVAVLLLARPTPSANRVAVNYGLADEAPLVETAAGFPAGNPGSPASLDDVRQLLKEFAQNGDARFLRYAESALDRLQGERSEVDEGLLRARIQQARHEFDAAAVTLRRVLDAAPGSAEGWLMYSDVLRRAGDLPVARRACMQLALAGHADLAGYCATEVMLAGGDYESAYQLARRQPVPGEALGDTLRRWTLEVRGEAAAAAGHREEALSAYAQAAQSRAAPFATRLAYADLLFAGKQYQVVLDLLAGDAAQVAAQVRILASARALGRKPDPELEARLAARFASPMPTAADALSFRDRALYELDCKGDAETALLFARANWQLQKGVEDFELVQAAAREAGDGNALRELDAWRAAARGFRR